MPKFDLRNHNGSPANIRRIIASKGLTPAQAAAAIGINRRTVDAWVNEHHAQHRQPHYVYQWALESLTPASSTQGSNSPQSKTATPAP